MDKVETSIVVSQNVFVVFDAISLIASIASLILAIVAIWLAISFKRDSDEVNNNTNAILIDIKSESKAISQGVMSELKAYGDAMRGNFSQNSTSGTSGFSAEASDFEFGDNKTIVRSSIKDTFL